MIGINTIGNATNEYEINNDTMKAHGYNWKIIRSKEFNVNGQTRTAYEVKKPRGRRSYQIIEYENGVISSAV